MKNDGDGGDDDNDDDDGNDHKERNSKGKGNDGGRIEGAGGGGRVALEGTREREGKKATGKVTSSSSSSSLSSSSSTTGGVPASPSGNIPVLVKKEKESDLESDGQLSAVARNDDHDDDDDEDGTEKNASTRSSATVSPSIPALLLPLQGSSAKGQGGPPSSTPPSGVTAVVSSSSTPNGSGDSTESGGHGSGDGMAGDGSSSRGMGLSHSGTKSGLAASEKDRSSSSPHGSPSTVAALDAPPAQSLPSPAVLTRESRVALSPKAKNRSGQDERANGEGADAGTATATATASVGASSGAAAGAAAGDGGGGGGGGKAKAPPTSKKRGSAVPTGLSPLKGKKGVVRGGRQAERARVSGLVLSNSRPSSPVGAGRGGARAGHRASLEDGGEDEDGTTSGDDREHEEEEEEEEEEEDGEQDDEEDEEGKGKKGRKNTGRMRREEDDGVRGRGTGSEGEGEEDDEEGEEGAEGDGREGGHSRRFSSSSSSSFNSRPLVAWTSAEASRFVELVGRHGKDYVAIAQGLPGRSPLEARKFFARHKRSMGLEKVAAGGPAKGAAAAGGGGALVTKDRRVRSSPRVSLIWNADERRYFLRYFAMYGKDWARISSHIPDKNDVQVKAFYESNKESLGLGELLRVAFGKVHGSGTGIYDYRDSMYALSSDDESEGSGMVVSPPVPKLLSLPSLPSSSSSFSSSSLAPSVPSLLSSSGAKAASSPTAATKSLQGLTAVGDGGGGVGVSDVIMGEARADGQKDMDAYGDKGGGERTEKDGQDSEEGAPLRGTVEGLAAMDITEIDQVNSLGGDE